MIKISKKIISVISTLIIVLVAFSVVSENCPSFADSEEKFLSVLRLALQDRLENGGDDFYSKKIKDVMSFYADIKDWKKADCSKKGKITGLTIKEILEDFNEKTKDLDILKCDDGTEYGKCSADTPSYCFFGQVIDKCSVCGCADGLTCHKDKCKTAEELAECDDGTKDGECSVSKPLFCDKGDIVYDCKKCGCYEGEICDKATNYCYVEEVVPCTVPSNGMIIDESIVLCEGAYDIPEGLIIEGDEISLDCNGATLRGNNAGVGLSINSRSYASIKNCRIMNYTYGLDAYSIENTAVDSNEFRNNKFGIQLNSSLNNEFKNNLLMYNNEYNIYLLDSENNIILDNNMYGSNVFDNKQSANVYCRRGMQNDYYSNAQGPKCELPNCGDGVCGEDENCFNCDDCGCGAGQICAGWECRTTGAKELSRLQREACKSADQGGTCDRLEKVGLVTAEQCCESMRKCC